MLLKSGIYLVFLCQKHKTFDAVLFNFFLKCINSQKYMPVDDTKVRFEKKYGNLLLEEQN